MTSHCTGYFLDCLAWEFSYSPLFSFTRLKHKEMRLQPINPRRTVVWGVWCQGFCGGLRMRKVAGRGSVTQRAAHQNQCRSRTPSRGHAGGLCDTDSNCCGVIMCSYIKRTNASQAHWVEGLVVFLVKCFVKLTMPFIYLQHNMLILPHLLYSPCKFMRLY